MPPAQQLTVKQALSRAKKAAKQGKLAVAQQLYQAVLQHQPRHPIATQGLRLLQKELPRRQSLQAQTANPSQDQINALINLYHSGQMSQVEQSCRQLLQTYSQSLIRAVLQPGAESFLQQMPYHKLFIIYIFRVPLKIS